MAQLSDDCFAHGGRLMRTAEALELLATSVVRVTEAEPVPVTDALGRILAEDVVSPHDVPERIGDGRRLMATPRA